MTIYQLWTRADAEKCAYAAYDHAADLLVHALDSLPDGAFKTFDRECNLRTVDPGHCLVTLDLSTGTISVGVAPAGALVPSELFICRRQPPEKDGTIVPFAPRG
jgi:hypothetical protein